jgi:serine/threonine-protein kinase
MGVVYRAKDRSLGREVAIKTLTAGIEGDSEMLARFYEEGRKTASFKHPNIVTIFELGDDHGVPYIVMELVDGRPLNELINAGVPMALVDRLRIIEELCSALAYAHRSNVIHRDVKPANIYVQPDGSIKLLDFGIARLEERKNQDINLTRTGYIIGTVPYMAPERLRNKPFDRRSDVFAAGVVLYQLVAGELPFDGDDMVMMQKILNDAHPPLSGKKEGIPPFLDAIVDRALAKAPNDRYQTADDMASDLASAIAELREKQALDLLPEAKRLMEADDLLSARATLQQLLKIQNRHVEGRELLAEVQRRLNERERGERIQQILQQAQGLLANMELDQCLALVNEGLELEPAHAELTKLRHQVEKEKDKLEKIRGFLREADSARREGNYQAAIAAARKALKVDKNNSKGMLLVNLLTKEAAEAERKAEVKELLKNVRSELNAKRFRDAIPLLNKAETLDPTNPELKLLFDDANSGMEQIRRKEMIAELENKVFAATTPADLQEAANDVQQALLQMPSESGLIQMKLQLDRRLKEQEARQFVDETVQACHKAGPREALEIVRHARIRLPGDERLLNLEGMLTNRLMQQTVESRREEILALARAALDSGKYSDAVHLLEVCQQEGIATEQMDQLLEFARQEEAERRRQDLLRERIEQAQSLIADSAFDEATVFLEAALHANDDAALRLLLEKAAAGKETLRAQIEGVLQSAHRLSLAGRHGEALEFLKGQPPAVSRSPRVQLAESAIGDEQVQAAFRTAGWAYASLGSDFAAGESNILRVKASLGNSLLGSSVVEAYQARARVVADRKVEELVNNSKAILRGKDKSALEELIARGTNTVEHAGPRAQADWKSMLQKSEKAGLLSRSGGE